MFTFFILCEKMRGSIMQAQALQYELRKERRARNGGSTRQSASKCSSGRIGQQFRNSGIQFFARKFGYPL